MSHTRLTLLLSLSLLFALPSWAAGGDSISYFTSIVGKFNRVFPQEKVYLHLDNTGYFVGETIWIKAYQTCTSNDSLGGRSDVVYVELVDAMGYVTHTARIKMHNGTGIGQIQLKDNEQGGFFEIRAYTRYMLNWGKDAIFSRVIPIFEKPREEGNYQSPVLLNKYMDAKSSNDKTPKRKALNIKFYPEGGHLVQGLKTRVAFELTDKSGRGVQAGCVLKAGDRELMRTQTGSDGRGIVTCTHDIHLPDQELTLTAISSDGQHDDFSLPVAETSGVAVSVDMLQKNTIDIDLASSNDLQGQTVGVTLLNNGKIYFCEEHALPGNKPLQLSINRKRMKEGVSQLTIIDGHGRILASRMLFVFPHTHVAPITVKVDSVAGRIITMSATTVPNTTFSMAVRDAGDDTNGNDLNAASWLLLSSDLKGYIQHPNYYLESDDDEHRRATDLLMMVQGWRRYNFRMMEGKENFAFDYPAERHMILNGRIYPEKKKLSPANINLSLVLTRGNGDDVLRGNTTTDRLGRYAFTVPDCWGDDWQMYITTTQNEKRLQYRIGIDRQFSPPTRQYSLMEQEPIELSNPMISLQEAINRGDLSIGVDSSHLLQQVNVTARRRRNRNFWERVDVGASKSSLYYNCLYDADAILDKGLPMPSLVDYLKQKNPNFNGNDNISGFTQNENWTDNFLSDGLSYGHRPIVWFVNNHFTCATGARLKNQQPNDHLARSEAPGVRFMSEEFPLSMDEAGSVYIDPRDHNDGFSNLLGTYAVYVYVYTNNSHAHRNKQNGFRYTYFHALNDPETYEQTELQGILPGADFRRTLYWNPNITTDAQGHASFDVVANSTCRELNYSAEGITRDGHVVVSQP